MTAPATTAATAPARWTPRLAPSRKVVTAGLLGAAATTSGLALTATSGWLIVRASARPVILTLLVAIVAVRTFGLARPVLRYAERLRSHDAALGDLAEQRTQVYAGLVPLTPARLGRRARSEVLGGVVDDLTDVVEAQARVTAPILAAGGAAAAAAVLAALLLPIAGLVVSALLVAAAILSRLAWAQESRSQQRLLGARAEVLRVSELVARQAVELQAIGAGGTAQRWLLEAQERFGAVSRAQSRGRALLSAGTLGATGVATAVTAWLVAGATTRQDVSGPVAALLVLVPVAVGEALGTLPDAVRALARAGASATRLARLLDQEPAVAATAVAPVAPVEAAAADPPAPAPHLRLSGVSAAWLRAPSRAGLVHRPAAGPAAAGPAAADPGAADPVAAGPVAADTTAADTMAAVLSATDLAPLDLDLPPGRRVAVVGANGSGKSTLVAVLARQLDPAGGHYTVDGRDIRDLPLPDVRE
ncbi:MAG TPA: ATP-binding cassette domain-containing protein, partial [Dermatophilaceae bacterium]|nr:ATP-binding cassette domain-containing protein [Dermatophilaceae bacterium]